jgi:predicted N-acetyltransferase YhbS
MNAASDSAPPDDPQFAGAITRETTADAAAVDALVIAAFGPGRFAKTAERLRERAPLTTGFCLYEGGRLIGSVRLWSVMAGEARSVFLGPIAVDKASRSTGLGGELVRACIEEAKTLGLDGVLLVGDPPYFSRFGFKPAPDAVLPGPVDQRRVMWLPFTETAPVGAVRADL